MVMDLNKVQLTTFDELHRIAEERVRNKVPELSPFQNMEASQRTVHKLEVHQIELEIQNEELRDARHEVETTLEQYADLYETAPAGYFTLDRNGTISAVNLTGANLLQIMRSLIVGQRFEKYLSDDYRSIFKAFLETVFNSSDEKTCRVMLLNNANHQLNIQIGGTVCTSGEECRLVLIDITGQKPIEQKPEYTHDSGAVRE